MRKQQEGEEVMFRKLLVRKLNTGKEGRGFFGVCRSILLIVVQKNEKFGLFTGVVSRISISRIKLPADCWGVFYYRKDGVALMCESTDFPIR